MDCCLADASSLGQVSAAALCVHLCIGQAYAFSVFNLPMTKLIGITQSTADDWKLTDLGWIFSIDIFFLGVSAAVLGRWVEEGGPRQAMFASGVCWAAGFLGHLRRLSTILGGLPRRYGVRRHRPRYRLHLACLHPDQWFPDRPGMATVWRSWASAAAPSSPRRFRSS